VDPFSLLLIVGAGAAFYFLIIRPGQQKQKAQRAMVEALGPGAEVMTTAGIFGTIAVVTDEVISLEIAPGVHMRLLPQAIAKVIEPAPSGDAPAQIEPPDQESEAPGT
jgi:preprotein translocase subunit YajC